MWPTAAFVVGGSAKNSHKDGDAGGGCAADAAADNTVLLPVSCSGIRQSIGPALVHCCPKSLWVTT